MITACLLHRLAHILRHCDCGTGGKGCCRNIPEEMRERYHHLKEAFGCRCEKSDSDGSGEPTADTATPSAQS